MGWRFKRNFVMNGNNIIVDTNFLIYLLNGREVVTPYLKNNMFISEITEMEMLGVKGLTLDVFRIRKSLIEGY